MIYADTSVLLAQLLAEDRKPPSGLWSEALISSRLTEYELWTRLQARGIGPTYGDAARRLLSRLSFIELSPLTLERALEPFPVAVRTLDALHLASLAYMAGARIDIELASYDRRMLDAAEQMGFRLTAL